MKTAYSYLPSQGDSEILVLCDHATNLIPDWVNDGCLGISDEDMNRHIAYDVGALGVSQILAQELNAHLLSTRFSRLVIDPNRGQDDPTLIMKIYDKTSIGANRGISDTERQLRLERLYKPYHDEISARLNAIRNMGKEPVIISIHSFTKQLRGREPRPWHIGVLSAEDRRLADPLIDHFGSDETICVGDNEPYQGALDGDTLDQHGIRQNIPHALIEIRNDLIETPEGQKKWAKICSKAIINSLRELGLYDKPNRN